MDNNFLPNIRCPFCNHVGPYAISGFGGELNVRVKKCPKCKREFVMIVYACALLPGAKPDADDILASLKERTKWLRRQRKKTVGMLLLEHNSAKKLYDESLEQARKMAEKRRMN